MAVEVLLAVVVEASETVVAVEAEVVSVIVAVVEVEVVSVIVAVAVRTSQSLYI